MEVWENGHIISFQFGSAPLVTNTQKQPENGKKVLRARTAKLSANIAFLKKGSLML